MPLHSAVHGGDIRAVELCLKFGAKISRQQHDLSTPVHLACAQGAIGKKYILQSLQLYKIIAYKKTSNYYLKWNK